jgi:hypothetical protein
MSTGTETRRKPLAGASSIDPVGNVGHGPGIDPLGFAFEQTEADLVSAVTYGPMVNPLG